MDEPVCGETYDHKVEIDYEDDELVQWHCTECGVEGEEDKSSPPAS